jgi:hypothetical protein
MTYGEMLQKIGTDYMQQFDKLVWVKALFSEYEKDSKEIWVIPDLRFKHEADFLKEKGAILIRVNGDPIGERKNSKRNLNHISETDLDDYKYFDFIIENDSTLYHFNNKIDNLINDLKLKRNFFLLKKLSIFIKNILFFCKMIFLNQKSCFVINCY